MTQETCRAGRSRLRSLALITIALLFAVPVVAQEKVSVRRLTDTVAIRRGPERTENVLYYFAASAELEEGDELEQGSSGHSQIYLSGGGLIEIFDQGHAILLRLDPEGDVIRFPWLTIATMTSSERALTCELPGGVIASFHQTQMEVRVEQGRVKIRNRGSQPIQVLGIISIEPGSKGTGQLELGQGQEAFLPLVLQTPEPQGSLREGWADMVLRHNGGFSLTPTGPDLEVRAADDPEAPRDDILTVGGVRTQLAGDVALISSHRREVAEAIDLYEVLGRISGSTEPLTPDELQELLLRFPIDQLRSMAATITEEMEAEDARSDAEGGSGEEDEDLP